MTTDPAVTSEYPLIRAAAEEAARQLPALQAESAQLARRMASLRSILQAWEALSGEAVLPHPARAPSSPSLNGRARMRHARGEAERDICTILAQGEAYSIAEVVLRLQQVLHVSYGDSTVGAVLRRGEKEGTFHRHGSHWSLAHQGGYAEGDV